MKLPDEVRPPLPEHGVERVVPLSGIETTTSGLAHWKGTRDGMIEVSCYCGRRVYRMTLDEVWSGVFPPACRVHECRDEESAR